MHTKSPVTAESAEKGSKASSCAKLMLGPENAVMDAGQSFMQRLHRVAGNRGAGLWLQTKLKVGAPDDAYEREADQVAEQVMRMPEPTVQRKCAACESGGPCSEYEHEKIVRRKSLPGPSSNSAGEISLGTGGSPLSKATRNFFESRMGYDFASVRIHTDTKAARSAQSLNAHAYTLGQDIAFGPGQYAPDTSEGRKLLAHELTHITQQAAVGNRNIIRRQPEQKDPTLTVSGDRQRTSPQGGVQLGSGSLSWNLQFKGVNTTSGSDPNGIGMVINTGTDVQMNAEFTPSSAAAKACPTISFIQVVDATVGGLPDAAHLLFIRDSATGLSADVNKASPYTQPFSELLPSSSGVGFQPEGNSTVAGSAKGRSASASFVDAPFLNWDAIPPGQTAVRKFEVAAICVESGKTFGSVKWGFTKTRNGVIALTGAQGADVKTGSASPEFEGARKAFYSGAFQFSLSGFGRGSAQLSATHRQVLQQVIDSGAAAKIILVGANDFSGGPEDNANLSLDRANEAQKFLVANGIPADKITVQGHGVEAKVPNAPGTQEPANRRVDVHIERGLRTGAANPIGSAQEALRFRHQDPHTTFEELVNLIFELQSKSGKIPVKVCDQLTHMVDGLGRQRALDRSVPNVETIYGPTIRSLRTRCESMIERERPPFDTGPTLPKRSFIDKIEQSVDDAGL